MNYAKIRFIVGAKGHYVDLQVCVPSDDIPEAAMQADIVCKGYEIGTGLKAMILEVRGVATTLPIYLIGRDAAKMHEYLKSLRGPAI